LKLEFIFTHSIVEIQGWTDIEICLALFSITGKKFQHRAAA